MVQLSASSVASPKTPKMGKAKTPKKSNALATPVKTEVKTPNQPKNTPKQAKNTPKQAKNTPAKAALQTPKSRTASAKKAKKVKTPKQEPAEDVEMALEGEEEAAPAPSPIKAQPSPKKSAKEEAVKSEDAEKSSEDEEIAVKPKSTKSAAAKEKINSKTIGKYSIFIRGLNFKTKGDVVTQHFSQFGKVTKCAIPTNSAKKGLNKGFGFVEFDSQEAMDKAMAAAHTLESRSLIITKSDADVAAGKRKRDESTERGGDQKRQASTYDNELFVARLGYSTTKDSLQEHFSQFGEVVSVGLPMKPDKSENKGFAFIAFKDASSLQKAVAVSDQVIDSSKVVIEPKKKVVVKEAPPKQSHPNELFVGGLMNVTQKHTLQEHFSKYGKVSNITLPWNKDAGKNKGFGFISFESAESLAAALEEDHEIDGKQIAVKSAGAKSEDKGAASKKVETMKVKAAPAAAKMEEDEEEVEEEDEEEVEEEDEEEEVEEEDDDEEGEEADSEDDEVEGEDGEDAEDEEDDDEEAEDEDSDDNDE